MKSSNVNSIYNINYNPINMFACRYCEAIFYDIQKYNKHQFDHKILSNIKIPCLYRGCKTKSKTYSSFQQHILRYHSNFQEGHVKCKYKNCSYKSFNINKMKKHMKQHLLKSNTEIICTYCLSGSKIFKTENAYRVHLFRHHRGVCQNDNLCDDSTATSSAQDNDQRIKFSNENNLINPDITIHSVQSVACNVLLKDVMLHLPTLSHNENNYDIQANENVSCNKNDNTAAISGKVVHDFKQNEDSIKQKKSADMNMCITKKLATIFLTLSAKHCATEPLLQGVMTNIYSAFDTCKETFNNLLQDNDISEENRKCIDSIFQKAFNHFSFMLHPNVGLLRNAYNRQIFYKNNFNYVQPLQVTINDKHGNATILKYSYVPILDTLKVMLNNENVRKFCMKPNVCSSSEGMFDVKDGTRINNTDFFKQANTLQIALYQDAFEICNPLGSSKTKFKILGVYMTLLNLPAHLRSKTENIKLVLLCREKYINEYTWSEILRNLIHDLKDLEVNGISVSINDESIIFKGSVVVMLGDNLGSHQVGGFTESFSNSKYFCRYCEKSNDQFHNNPFDKQKLRDIESYTKCVNEAQITKKIIKGIKKNSALNDLLYYHVSSPGLPPCIDHDVFEGIVPCDMQLAIDYFLKMKWFKVGILNFRLNETKFVGESNIFIPSITKSNKNKKKLTGSASQMRRLIMIFPLAVGDLIKNFEDKVWKMVIVLRELCSFLCAPALSHSQIVCMKHVIDKYVRLRMECFPQVKLRPKHEYILHYYELTVCFGPLRHLSTIRFESKHKYFKQLIKQLQNYKNVTQTLSEKHEFLQCSLENQFNDVVESKNIICYDMKNYSCSISDLIESHKSSSKIKYVSNDVTFRGVRYKKDMVVCTGKSKYGNFIICKIQMILINEDLSNIYFLGNIKEIVSCPLVGVYEIVNYSECERLCNFTAIFDYSSLLSPHPLLESHIQSISVFVTKYVPYGPDL